MCYVVTALVCLGYYYKLPHSAWLLKICWSQFWRLESLRSRYQYGCLLGRVPFLVLSQHPLAVASHDGRSQGSSGASFICHILSNSGLYFKVFLRANAFFLGPWCRSQEATSLYSPVEHSGYAPFSPPLPFLNLFPYFSLFPATAILDQLAMLLILMRETASSTAPAKEGGLNHPRDGVTTVCTTSPPRLH